MTIPSGADAQAVEYILDWWSLYPSDLPDDVDVDGTETYRRQLFEKVNEATGGELARLVSVRSLHWIFLVGLAAAEATKRGM